MSLNHVSLLGRVVTEPLVGTVNNGTKRARFRFAVDDSYTRDGIKVERTIWCSVTAWGAAANTVEQFVRNKQLIIVEGKLEPLNEWEDKATGQHRAALAINCKLVHLLPKSLNPSSSPHVEGHEEPGEDEMQVANGRTAGHPVTGKATPEDEDIPF